MSSESSWCMANFERLGRGRGGATKEREPVAATRAVLKQRGNVVKVPAGQEPSEIHSQRHRPREHGVGVLYLGAESSLATLWLYLKTGKLRPRDWLIQSHTVGNLRGFLFLRLGWSTHLDPPSHQKHIQNLNKIHKASLKCSSHQLLHLCKAFSDLADQISGELMC